MTNNQILIILGLWIVIIVQFLREKGFNFNWRILSIILGGVLGFLWWLCSVINDLNWLLFLIGAQPVNENIILLILKGIVAGFGATYSYAVIETLFKKIGK